jgi:1-acyl-sn-glycerol-3-phosphate acyltransferase
MIRHMATPSRTYRLLGQLSRPLAYGVFRLEARGVERLPSGGFVLAANHVSNLDPWSLGMPLFPQRWLRFMAKSELYWWPLTLVLDGAGAFKVRRGIGDVEAIETAVELVRSGEIVVMFPEGTRRKKGLRKKWTARPHTGAARIAQHADAALVPAAIKGTDRLARLGRWKVAYGEPFGAGDDAEAATERLMREIEALYDTL